MSINLAVVTLAARGRARGREQIVTEVTDIIDVNDRWSGSHVSTPIRSGSSSSDTSPGMVDEATIVSKRSRRTVSANGA